MNEQQKNFIKEYVISGNMYKSALKAGYSKSYANGRVANLLEKPDIKAYYSKLLKELESEQIAGAKEVLEYLSSVMRGKSTSEVVVTELIGDGCSKAVRINKLPDEKAQLRAAELLGKRYRLFTDKLELDEVAPVVIVGADELED